MNKKLIGSFYTPKIIADFLVNHLSKKVRGKELSVLEPSSGDGIFIKTILNDSNFSKKIKEIVAVEREEEEIRKVKLLTKSKVLKTVNKDFLDFQNNNKQKFNLVVGNPPYIKKSLLDERQILLCERIHKSFSSLSINKIKNIWTAFLVRSISFLKEDGVLALVLPAELLQVKYALELRELLQTEFERIEIFTFKELLFEGCKGQDTLILVCEKKSISKGVFFTQIDDVNMLGEKNFKLAKSTNIKEAKWNHQLSSDEYELIDKLSKKIKTVNDYCSSKAGIVTAANDFFIVNKDIAVEYKLTKYLKPIIQKGIFVNGSVELNSNDFDTLIENSKPSFLLALNNETKYGNNKKIIDYLKIGFKKELNQRYKMTIRNNWYEVPNVGSAPEAFFFKRCNEYPKLIKNNASVLVTDSAYKIEMKNEYDINTMIYSFYNSLTLAFAELNGRFYGGGVLELTPNEFKGLPIPYTNINTNEFNKFAKKFKSKNSIKEICKISDCAILKSIDSNLDLNTIDKIYSIREKLYLNRIKH
jgi:adenine-specific DNA-methyltransferase